MNFTNILWPCCKVWKISLEQILREACINVEHSWDNITHLAQKKNFWEIPFKLLYLFIMLYIMLQILKITFSKNHDIKGCIIMGHNCAKIAHVAKNRIFLEI